MAESADAHGLAGKSGSCQNTIPASHLGGEEEKVDDYFGLQVL
jgi:hypothetical protein